MADMRAIAKLISDLVPDSTSCIPTNGDFETTIYLAKLSIIDSLRGLLDAANIQELYDQDWGDLEDEAGNNQALVNILATGFAQNEGNLLLEDEIELDGGDGGEEEEEVIEVEERAQDAVGAGAGATNDGSAPEQEWKFYKSDLKQGDAVGQAAQAQQTAGAIAVGSTSSDERFLQNLVLYNGLWHLLYHTCQLMMQMYGVDILGPINAVSVDKDADEDTKIISFQHIFHLNAVAYDSINQWLFAQYRREVEEEERDDDVSEEAEDNLVNTTATERTAALDPFDVQSSASQVECSKLFEEWLEKKIGNKETQSERTYAHYAQFVYHSGLLLLMYFAGRNGNVYLWHDCVEHFGPVYPLYRKHNYLLVYLQSHSLMLSQNPLQNLAYKTFFAASLSKDLNRRIFDDERLECTLNVDCKGILPHQSLKQVGERIGFVQYSKEAKMAVREVTGVEDKPTRYNRIIDRAKSVQKINESGILNVIDSGASVSEGNSNTVLTLSGLEAPWSSLVHLQTKELDVFKHNTLIEVFFSL